ncbi:MAG: hypothetical protein FWH01_14660 [Oscillospiraceae bacterium]|nr:hypothetical protein [Oscillospiraceae bacterium]
MTGGLPDERTIIVEHFQNEVAENQIVVHSVFGKRINSPMALLARESARNMLGSDVGVYDDDDGFLLFPIGGKELPGGLLYTIEPSSARSVLDALLPATPLFSMSFRYNAARALMMGVRKRGRQPLWIQRQRGAKMLDQYITVENHPLIWETKRECVENYWDINGLIYVLESIRSGAIAVRDVYTYKPSPMSLPLRRAVESELMYDYTPTAPSVEELSRAAVTAAISEGKAVAPGREELDSAGRREKKFADEHQLHALLMTEGDQVAGETDAPIEWFEELAQAGRALYIEPGLWIAAEHADEYAAAYSDVAAFGDATAHSCVPAFSGTPATGGAGSGEAAGITGDNISHTPENARSHIVRRALRYHGGHTQSQVADRYGWPGAMVSGILGMLADSGELTVDGDIYYHTEVYEYARRQTILARRAIVRTQPPERYAALLAARVAGNVPGVVPDAGGSVVSNTGAGLGAPPDRILAALRDLRGHTYPAAYWENVLLPGRVAGYRPEALDAALARGEFFWHMGEGMSLSFHAYDDVDWSSPDEGSGPANNYHENASALDGDERIIYDALARRGALFTQGLAAALGGSSPYDALLSLVEKGLVRSDSFIPVRQLIDREHIKGTTVRQRARARAQMLTAGRWEVSRGAAAHPMKERLARVFENSVIVCRETAMGISWLQALEVLRVWEYTGQVRRGYYVEGLSGAQFVREQDFAYVTAALARTDEPIAWLPAPDPAQPWGKSLPHLPGRSFMNLPGNVVCLRGGVPVMVFERQGQALRMLGDGENQARDSGNNNTGNIANPIGNGANKAVNAAAQKNEDSDVSDDAATIEALNAFVALYTRRRLYGGRGSLTIKSYPPAAAKALEAAGFTRYIQDYVLYRK